MVKAVVAVGSSNTSERFIKPSIEALKVLCCFVMNDENQKNESMYTKYNKGVASLINLGMTDPVHKLQPHDVICFIHEDVKIEDPLFLSKIETVFQTKQDVGIVGLAGTSMLSKEGGWWNSPKECLRGHLIQGHPNTEPHHLIFNTIGYYDDLVVDGFFMAIRADLFLNKGLIFDSNNFIGYDFYDLDICLQVLNLGYKVAVIDTLLFHNSEGEGALKENWKNNKHVFINKWEQKGKTFPIQQKQFTLNQIDNINILPTNQVETIEV